MNENVALWSFVLILVRVGLQCILTFVSISIAEAFSLPGSRVDPLKKVKSKIIAGSIDQLKQLSSYHRIKTGKFAYVGSRKIVGLVEDVFVKAFTSYDRMLLKQDKKLL